MRSKLERSINMCFSKIKLPGTTPKVTTDSPPFPPKDHSRPLPHPTTTTESPSFPPEDLSRPLPNPTTTTTTNLVKNFNSLYDDPTFDSTSLSKSLSSSSPSSSSSSAAPDLAAAFASQRFFFSSPGRSNSIVESSSSFSFSSSSSLTTSVRSDSIVGGGVAVPTYSQDPFEDFRRSMQEMVEARRLVDVSADWDHLHELLTCYLSLNPKSAHKFIVRAFSDLLVSMMAPPPTKNGGRG
ncbi:transcription repressor OFP12-like [Rhododendron vialii]|uniref:transcription repressor OFP12-like n=1 Tax=Rhododendron vialii TaxID=182163 RepID=UPI00266023FB|nr:transcription repressor OFP12-like [Rhododendron vialii]